MDIQNLQEFVVLAQTGNFLEAAELLFISQSTLSKHIKKIEIEFGVPLFNRTTRKVELSHYGEMAYPYAQQLVQTYQDCAQALQAHVEKEQNQLAIGSIPELAEYHITDTLIEFKREHHHVTVDIAQADTDALKEMLLQNKCELAFIRETEIPEDPFIRLPYATDSLVAVVPMGHPLAGRGPAPLSSLAHEDLLFTDKQSMVYDLCRDSCLQSGFAPKIALTDHKPENLADFVQKGMGVALLMKRVALYLQNPEVAIIDLTPTASTYISLCYRKDVKLSPAARRFIQCTKMQPPVK